MNNGITSVIVPLDTNLITALQRVEDFVKENVDSPRYKPLWLTGAMCVNVSKWCIYELIDIHGNVKPFTGSVTLGDGWYTYQIQVSHAYIGPHRGGETFSLSLHVTKIRYQPQDPIDEVLVDLMKSIEPEKPDKKRKRSRKKADTEPPVVPAKASA